MVLPGKTCNMDISLSASMKPRPIIRPCRGRLSLHFHDGHKELTLIGVIMPGRQYSPPQTRPVLFKDTTSRSKTNHQPTAGWQSKTHWHKSRWPSLVNIAGDLMPYQKLLKAKQPIDPYSLKKHIRHWLLVLEARGIPFACCRSGKQLTLYVPAILSRMAILEINEFSLEGTKQASFLPSRPWWLGGICVALLLLIWHLLRFNSFAFVSLPSPPFPDSAAQWVPAFGLDTFRTATRGEWWRLATALTLHSDLRHLLSNLVVGGVFFALLAGRTGFRTCLFLAISGGILGNAIALFFKSSHIMSIGFSTSCFALVGALGAYVFCDMGHVKSRHRDIQLLHAPRWFTPIAAGLALLAMLGGAGQPNTDFIAHCTGMLMGFTMAIFTWFLGQLLAGKPRQNNYLSTLLCLLACGLLAGSWVQGLYVFNQ